MKTIKIFLASSAELVADREEIREMISVENDRLHPKGIYLQLVQWEFFTDAVSPSRLQDEYNKAIAGCDVVLSLFHTKAGKYTQEEFQFAYDLFLAHGKPLIYTYFKASLAAAHASEEGERSLAEFKAYLSQIGHFPTRYPNIDDLKYQLKLQLDRLLEGIPTESSMAPERGYLLHKIPQRMQLQALHRCLIRVAHEQDALLRDLPAYAADYVLRDHVRMAGNMEVVLVENAAFEVMAINDERQAVEKGDATEWNFDVRPLKLGRHPLTFRVSVELPNGVKQVVLTEAVQVVTEQVADSLETLEVNLPLDLQTTEIEYLGEGPKTDTSTAGESPEAESKTPVVPFPANIEPQSLPAKQKWKASRSFNAKKLLLIMGLPLLAIFCVVAYNFGAVEGPISEHPTSAPDLIPLRFEQGAKVWLDTLVVYHDDTLFSRFENAFTESDTVTLTEMGLHPGSLHGDTLYFRLPEQEAGELHVVLPR